MPWKARGNKIIRSDTGKVVGKSKDHATAMAAVRARYANTPKDDYKPCGKSCGGGKMLSKD